MFDNSVRRTDAVVISSLDNFMEGMLSVRDWAHVAGTSGSGSCTTCNTEADIDFFGNDLYAVPNVTDAKVQRRRLTPRESVLLGLAKRTERLG